MAKILPMEEKLLQTLPPAALAGRLMSLPAARRLAILLERADAEAVVAALPEPDFCLFVKELDPGAAAPLLAMARPGQLTHLIDIDGWQGDELLAGKTLAWCEAMLAANEARFLAWLYQVDFEFLVALFRKWLDRVEIAGEEERDFQEESDFLPLLTVDSQYYFSSRYPAHDALLKYLLSYLFENHHGFYLSLLHGVRTALDTEVSELAYRFHRGRLADHAIPDAEEAATIYRPLAVTALARDKLVVADEGGEAVAAPTFALARVRDGELFALALARITASAIRATLQMELAALANKVVVADRLPPDDPESLRFAVDKVMAAVNLALDLCCGGEPAAAAEALSRIYLENLFRCGHGRLASVARRLEGLLAKGWLKQWPHGLNLLDPPWLEAADLLLGPTPLVERLAGDAQPGGEDFCRTAADLAQAEAMVAMIESLAAVFADCQGALAGDWQSVADSLDARGQIRALAEVTLGSLVFTGAANGLWRGVWEVAPLPVARWGDVAPLLAPAALEAAVAERLGQVLPDEESRRRATRYLAPLFIRYREEMAGLAAVPEPHLVPFFLFGAAGS